MAPRQEPGEGLGGIHGQSDPPRATGAELAGAALALAWLGLSTAYAVTREPALDLALSALVVVLPVGLIWLAVTVVRSTRAIRTETARLSTAVDALRQAYVAQGQQGRSEPPNPTILKRLDEIAAQSAGLEAKLTLMASARIAEGAPPPVAAPPAPAPQDDQPRLSLASPSDARHPPLANADFIRALHFPETAEDTEGFAALRRALQDRQAAQLIQAAQDVLTLLSQDGIYMDDLSADLARPETWRAFARGARGRAVAALGGVHDRTTLALSAGRMKQDTIFRDAVHHFLRRFDKVFATFEPNATDAEISQFAATRTARAFMILGRVAGTFD